jgi:DNA-binding transcriptional regulator LsrR (DeoR family)
MHKDFQTSTSDARGEFLGEFLYDKFLYDKWIRPATLYFSPEASGSSRSLTIRRTSRTAGAVFTVPKQDNKLDLAARAAWLYYVSGNTQEEIAAKLNLSRPGAQRLIALAMEQGFVKVRINHPIADCMVLARALRKRFDLTFCDVVPTDPGGPAEDLKSLAIGGAHRLEEFISRDRRTVIALGTGRTLRAAVDEMVKIDRPQHAFVSLAGNVARDGSTNPYDAVMHLTDKTGGKCFLLPAPVVADSAHHRDELVNQQLYRVVQEMAETADIAFIGIGRVAYDAPLHRDGFITDDEVDELVQEGAVGEMLGWALDQNGALLPFLLNRRIASLALASPPNRPTIAIAGGAAKARAILAVLNGRWITGLITDEAAAKGILDAA